MGIKLYQNKKKKTKNPSKTIKKIRQRKQMFPYLNGVCLIKDDD